MVLGFGGPAIVFGVVVFVCNVAKLGIVVRSFFFFFLVSSDFCGVPIVRGATHPPPNGPRPHQPLHQTTKKKGGKPAVVAAEATVAGRDATQRYNRTASGVNYV